MVTRGKKKTPNRDPRFALGRATIAIVAEFKIPKPESKSKGLTLMTSTVRCGAPTPPICRRGAIVCATTTQN
ncbi:hypothetical protein [Rhizobium sp. FY34]|uniref:hypothetical protein n=1 Tax=Rhizobium sp. FY34 TaxID=2562309 RepID=UPI001980CB8E|nr:hypothetical protein [Rhizobium sp. FY34]